MKQHPSEEFRRKGIVMNILSKLPLIAVLAIGMPGVAAAQTNVFAAGADEPALSFTRAQVTAGRTAYRET